MKIAVKMLRYALTGKIKIRKFDVLYAYTGLYPGHGDHLHNHPLHCKL